MSNYRNLREEARRLLFEDSYNVYSDQNNLRAGTQFPDGEEEEDPLIDMPVVVQPQMATQLSQDLPPIEDPTYVPATGSELGRALNVMSQSLPDDVVEKVYAKFQKFVDDFDKDGLDVEKEDEEAEEVENAEAEEGEEEAELEEARARIKNQLIVEMLNESWDDFKLDPEHPMTGDSWSGGMPYGQRGEDEEDDAGPSDSDLEAVERGDPNAGEVTLAQVAKEMGISTSGAKKTEGEALAKMRLSYEQFPGDFDKIRAVALPFMLDTMEDLDLMDAEDLKAFRSEFGSNPNIDAWPALRVFIWDTFLQNVYKKMMRDAQKQGLDPTSELNKLDVGLYDRAMDYWNRYPHGKKVEGVLKSLGSDA